MGDNLFAGLNMDFNFADSFVPSSQHQLGSVGRGRHKRHKSSPDVLGQLSFAMLLAEDGVATVDHSVPHPAAAATQPPLASKPGPVPLSSQHGNSSHNPWTSTQTPTRGQSFIEDVDLDDILQDFLEVPDLRPTTAPHPSTPHHHQNHMTLLSSSQGATSAGYDLMMPPNVLPPQYPAQLFHAHQKLHENVLDLKRKSRHERHQSNPDGLFYHAQQLRQLHQQHSIYPSYPPRQPASVITSTAADTLGRRLPTLSPSVSELLQSDAPSGVRPKKRTSRSTGISMDLSQIAVLDDLQTHSVADSPGVNSHDHVVDDVATSHESTRKSYKCGRCGQPKVGHVCSLPDLRNNWSQADLAITRGMKGLDANCKVLASRRYTVVHPDHADHFTSST